MAEFSKLCAGKGASEDALLPASILKAAERGKLLSPEKLDQLFSLEDLDALESGDGSIYAALLASLSSGGVMATTSEPGIEEAASQGEVAKTPELAGGALPAVVALEEEVVKLPDAMNQEMQAQNNPATSAEAHKLSENPNIPSASSNEKASAKALETAPVFDEAILAEESSAPRKEPTQELFKILDEVATGKNSEAVGEALNRRSQTGKDHANASLSSPAADDSVAKFAEGLQSPPDSDSPEPGFAEAAKNSTGHPSNQVASPSSDVNLPGMSSSLEAGGSAELAGKEFVNVREGVEYVRLPSGQMINKYAVLDQVIQQVSLRNAAQGKTVTIRMHPQELGELKLDLILENDKVRVNIQTQTQMVQDVMEQHLPRLREVLENQGVRVGEMQLSLDSQQHQGSESFRHSNPGQDGSQQRFQFTSQARENRGQESIDSPSQEYLAGSRNATRTGLSLRI